jgi:hypothetical protein
MRSAFLDDVCLRAGCKTCDATSGHAWCYNSGADRAETSRSGNNGRGCRNRSGQGLALRPEPLTLMHAHPALHAMPPADDEDSEDEDLEENEEEVEEDEEDDGDEEVWQVRLT